MRDQQIFAGFADAGRQSQACFRACMDALARPGTFRPYRSPLAIDQAIGANAAALALTLVDFEVRFHLAPSLADAAHALMFHTGSSLASRPAEAEFAFLDLDKDRLDLASFAQGEPDYPDRSTTIIALTRAIDPANGFTIAGPGIKGVARLGIAGLPGDFAMQWAANRAQFPLGVDMIFASPEGLCGLPRSTRIIEETR